MSFSALINAIPTGLQAPEGNLEVNALGNDHIFSSIPKSNSLLENGVLGFGFGVVW